MHLGNCWRPATAANLVKNCRKTCVCKCCSSSPVPLPTTATLSKTTTAKKVSTTCQTTAAIILYRTATARQTAAATILYSTKTASQTTAVNVLYSTSTEERKTTTGTKGTFVNRPFAAKPSRDLLFIKLWAATLRMPEMEKACRKHQNGQVWSAWH